MAELRDGSANQAALLNEKLNAVIYGIENQAELLNSRLKELIAERRGQDSVHELLRGIRDGISDETKVMQKMNQLIQSLENQSRLLNEKLSALAQRSE